MPSSPRLSETGRLEAFSDAVFAIVLTLLVLDLLPEARGQDLAGLLEAWPRYLAFLTAFVTVGVIWLSHHDAFTRIRKADPRLLVLNLALLLSASLVPWPTALVASAVGQGDAGEETAAVLAFSLVTLLIGLTWTGLDLHLVRHPALLESTTDVDWVRRNLRRSIGSVVAAVVGAGIGLIAPLVAIVFYLVVPLSAIVITFVDRGGARQPD